MDILKGVRFAVRASAILLFLAGLYLVDIQKVEATRPSHGLPRGVYLELNRDFYEALQGRDGTGTARTYSNDSSQEYLRRIAVASEFTVKTNLEILQQQEKIIRLLESLEKQAQQGR